MPNWDQIVANYEAQIDRLEGQLLSSVETKSANKAIVVFSLIAFVGGVFVGWAL